MKERKEKRRERGREGEKGLKACRVWICQELLVDHQKQGPGRWPLSRQGKVLKRAQR